MIEVINQSLYLLMRLAELIIMIFIISFKNIKERNKESLNRVNPQLIHTE